MQYSVVIPLKDEKESIYPLLQEVEEVMSSLGKPWEVICVDDGSKDGTLDVLRSLKKKMPQLKILSFAKNAGQSSAFSAGFQESRGELVITMDGDGQNDPKDIPKLIAKIDQFDLVCGRRQKRNDNLVKKLTSKIANYVRSRVCKDGMEDTGCSLKVYRRSSLMQINRFNGMHRFLPALFIIEGFKVTQVPVNDRKRRFGRTKYGFSNRSLSTVIDMLGVLWMRRRRLTYQIQEKV